MAGGLRTGSGKKSQLCAEQQQEQTDFVAGTFFKPRKMHHAGVPRQARSGSRRSPINLRIAFPILSISAAYLRRLEVVSGCSYVRGQASCRL